LKSILLITTLCVTFLLYAGTAGAATLDFSGHDYDHHQSNDSKNGDNADNGLFSTDPFGHQGSPNGNKDGKNHDDSSNTPSWWTWKDYAGDGGKGGDQDKNDHMSPPLWATADYDHHDDKHDHSKDPHDRDWGDHRFVKYYANICDGGKDGRGDPSWHHRDPKCDPDPAPLPGALSMFGMAFIVLCGFSLYKKYPRIAIS
jgi:hypothetical protein